MREFRSGDVVWIVLWGCDVVLLIVALVMGLLAVNRARPRNRPKHAGWALWLEPEAFSGDGARYRRWFIRATGALVVLTLALFVLGHALGIAK